MLKIMDLKLGFNDAENYRMRRNKEMFTQIFIRTSALDLLCSEEKFFLIGEKGTGKTAHAVYLSNNPYFLKNITNDIGFYSDLVFIRETEYQKFVELKNKEHLSLSDFTNIWKVIIYLLIANKISNDESIENAPITNTFKFFELRRAINNFYNNAFSPEIINAMTLVEKSALFAELLEKAKLGMNSSKESTVEKSNFQINLLKLQREFEAAISALKLRKHHILFIDGIDLRPSNIAYDLYLECIKGLVNAIWSINSDYFSNIKDSKGRIRVVILMRPDIFESVGLQNLNNKIRDNSVVLDWITSYQDYRTSNIFSMTDKLFSSQQEEKNLDFGIAWDTYFPFKLRNWKTKEYTEPPFIQVLRMSMYRPRDIISFLRILQDHQVAENKHSHSFSVHIFRDPKFLSDYSEYLLGEVKDQLSFYHTSSDYEVFLQFFTYWKGKLVLTYQEYTNAYNELIEYVRRNNKSLPPFFETTDSSLQFLYELNVLCYREETTLGDVFLHWCFKDRGLNNLSPKVKTKVTYEIHYGLSRALGLGRELNT